MAAAAVVAGVSILLGEAALQGLALFVPYVRYQIARPGARDKFSDPVLGIRMSRFFPGHDEHGYRNEDSLKVYDTLAVGDSNTYGFGVAPAESWPRQFHRLTNRSVYNAGVGGYGPCEYRGVLLETLRFKPRVVVVAVSLQNDILDAYSSVYQDRRCADLATSDPDVLSRLANADRSGTLRDQAARYAGPRQVDAIPRPVSFYKRTALYGFARSVWSTLRVAMPAPSSPKRDRYEAAASHPFCVGMDAPAPFRTVFQSPELMSLAVDLADPRVSEGVRVLLAAFDDIRGRVEAQGAALVIALIHNKPFVLQEVIKTHRPDVDRVYGDQIALEGRMTERLVAELSSRGYRIVDTAAAMQSAVRRGIMPYQETDDHHPRPIGYEIIASAIFEALTRPPALYAHVR